MKIWITRASNLDMMLRFFDCMEVHFNKPHATLHKYIFMNSPSEEMDFSMHHPRKSTINLKLFDKILNNEEFTKIVVEETFKHFETDDLELWEKSNKKQEDFLLEMDIEFDSIKFNNIKLQSFQNIIIYDETRNL